MAMGCSCNWCCQIQCPKKSGQGDQKSETNASKLGYKNAADPIITEPVYNGILS